jgi:hypothetical protein
MRKHVSFTIAATILALAMVSWFKASVVETNADIARPRVHLSSSVSNPYPSDLLTEAAAVKAVHRDERAPGKRVKPIPAPRPHLVSLPPRGAFCFGCTGYLIWTGCHPLSAKLQEPAANRCRSSRNGEFSFYQLRTSRCHATKNARGASRGVMAGHAGINRSFDASLPAPTKSPCFVRQTPRSSAPSKPAGRKEVSEVLISDGWPGDMSVGGHRDGRRGAIEWWND